MPSLTLSKAPPVKTSFSPLVGGPKAFNHTLASPRSEAITLTDRAGERGNLLFILNPARSGLFEERNHVAIFISDTKNTPLHLPVGLKSLYALTDKEFLIVNLMVRKFNIKEIATETFSSEATIRTQTKAIFSKTNTRRQSEVVALFLSNGAMLIGNQQLTENISGSTSKTIIVDQPRRRH